MSLRPAEGRRTSYADGGSKTVPLTPTEGSQGAYSPAAFALRVVMSAVSTAITISTTRFSVLFVLSVIINLLSLILYHHRLHRFSQIHQVPYQISICISQILRRWRQRKNSSSMKRPSAERSIVFTVDFTARRVAMGKMDD